MHIRKIKKKQKLQKISLILLSTSFGKQAIMSEDSCVTPSFALLILSLLFLESNK